MCLFPDATTSDGCPIPRHAGALCNGLIRSFAERYQEERSKASIISYVSAYRSGQGVEEF